MARNLTILLIYLIFACESASQTSDFYEISRLPFTSDKFDEFAPAYYGTGLVFTTNRRTGFLISRLTDEGENLYNIYFAEKSQSGRWRNPKILSRKLKSNYHDGTVSFSPDGSRVFFTRNIPGQRNEPSKLGIFMADNVDGSWVNITPFPYNSSNYNVCHPSISQDGNTLYYSSDIPGGFGGMDIYSSSLQGASWSAPANLGEVINSPGDEVFPYIHHGSGRLYLSSDKGVSGTLDLYYSTLRNNSWQAPVRMPGPFNSASDDFGLVADGDMTSGYFSSRREGTDNIYAFTSTFPVFTRCEEIREPDLCYIFYEETGEVDTTTFYFEWDMGDGTKIRGQEADHCFDDIGTYFIRLDVIDIITGEISHNQASYVFTIDKVEQPFITSPDTCIVDQQISLSGSETWLRNFDIDQYYWELGDGTKLAGETIYHTYTEPGTYEVRLGVLSDPDSPYGLQRRCVHRNIVVLGNNPD